MKTVIMREVAGEFGENKDAAKKVREEILLPTVERGEGVTFDFEGMTGATQSFIHALVSETLRRYPDKAYDLIFYKNASDEVKEIISIVYMYMQQE